MERRGGEEELAAARREDYEAYKSVVSYPNPRVGVEVDVIGQVRSAPYTQGGPRSLEEEAAGFFLDSVPGGTVWEAPVVTRDVSLVSRLKVERIDKEDATDPTTRNFVIR